VIFSQILDDDLGCASYLVGDEEAGVAVAVDPLYAVERLLEEAGRHDVRIVRVVETHTHADHLSGHGRLALDHGIPVNIHPAAEAEYPHDPLEDGQEVEAGRSSFAASTHRDTGRSTAASRWSTGDGPTSRGWC
jgi:glyoxylase-like metal-dependent hydrolase (beta-lactamase superfamily II)